MNQHTFRIIDHYEILELIGHGGMSTVYKARDTRMMRLVALKLVDGSFAKDVDFQARFLATAHKLTGFDHPHIVRVFDAGVQEADLFLAMEYVNGHTLRSHLQSRLGTGEFLDLREIVTISRQVAQALAYAHEKGVIHHDVKPDNVMLQPNREVTDTTNPTHTLLSDFGLAKRLVGIEPLTGNRELSGTLAYMAPELFRANEVDHRIDIYAFGVMLYELVTGHLPFNSPSASDLMLMQLQGEPERVMDLRPDVPPALVSIIHRAMLKNPDDRYETALEIARELEALEKSIRLITQSSLRMGHGPVTPSVSGPATIYDVLPALDRPAIPVDLLSEGTDDVIVVTSFEGKSWRVPFEKPSVTIGREKTCDIQLDDPRVSRQHSRIDRLLDGKIAVADLGSLNGLYVGDEKVPKGGVADWPSTQSLKIGPFWLTQRLSQSPVAEGRRLILSTPRAIEANLGSQNATLQLSPSEVVIEPGISVVVRLEVLNKSPDAHYYAIQIKGIAEQWFTILPFALYVPTGMRSERVITLHPPRTSATVAGSHNFTVNVAPKEDSQQVTSLSGTLHVVHFFDYESALIQSAQGFKIIITNKGNSDRHYVIEAREPQNRLVMLPSRVRILAGAGYSTPVEIQVRAKRRPLTGAEYKLPIDIYIRTDGLPPQAQTFEYTIRPLLTWDMIVLAFLVLGLLLILLRSR